LGIALGLLLGGDGRQERAEIWGIWVAGEGDEGDFFGVALRSGNAARPAVLFLNFVFGDGYSMPIRGLDAADFFRGL
jgi:hypothetical protein